MKSKIAILVPSYRRMEDLENVLRNTPYDKGKFIVVANYPKEEYEELSSRYSDRAIFVDETKHGKLGVCGAYNLAFETAVRNGFEYCVLFADDVLPYKKSWLREAVTVLEDHDATIGIFSSDEGHYGSYGWNIIKDAPIGHFFIARVRDLDVFFDTKYKQYVIDLEIIVRNLEQKRKVVLIPVRVNHLRSPLNRESYGQNYEKDLSTFLSDYPEYKDWMNSNGRELFIPETKTSIDVQKGWTLPKTYPWPAHKEEADSLSFFKKILKG